MSSDKTACFASDKFILRTAKGLAERLVAGCSLKAACHSERSNDCSSVPCLCVGALSKQSRSLSPTEGFSIAVNFGAWRPTEGPSSQAQPPESAAITMITAMYTFFHKLQNLHSNLAASKHLAGLKLASDSACKTLADQAVLHDAELVMYNDKLCENLFSHLGQGHSCHTPAASPPSPTPTPAHKPEIIVLRSVSICLFVIPQKKLQCT